MADRSVKVKFDAVIGGYSTGIAQMREETSKFATDSAASATKSNQHWQTASTAMIGAGLALAAGLGLAVARFADFDQAMSAVNANVETTGNQLDALRELAIKLGADTQFSATEAAQAINEMGKAGVSAADILGGGLKGALDLAAAGQLEVGRAGEIAATAMNQFGLAGKDIPHIADLYAAAAGKAQGSVEDIANAMKYVGPVAKSMGISIEEATAVIAEFASKGIIGEQAGTSFRGMLLALSAPSRQAAKTLEQYGISVYEANGKMKTMSGIADELQRGLGGLDQATRNEALGRIFGNESMTAAITLYEGGSQAVQKWQRDVSDAGFATRQAAALTDNLRGDLERLGGSLDTVLIQQGSGANASLRWLTQTVEGAVNAFSALPGPVQVAMTGLVGLSAAGLIVGGGLIKVMTQVQLMKARLVEMGVVSDATATKMATIGKKGAVAFGKLAAAITATALASSALDGDVDQLGTNKLADSLKNSANAADALNSALSSSVGTGTPYDSNIRSIGDALRTAFNPSTFEQADDAAGSMWSAIGGNNLSDIELAKGKITEIDAALAKLVGDGNTDKAAATFKALSDEAQRQGISVDDLKKKFPQYTEALAGATSATVEATDSVADYATAAQTAVDATKAFSDSIKGVARPLLDERDAARQVETSIDAVSKALKDNGKSLDIHTEKGRNNLAALDGVAKAMVDQIGAMQANGASQSQLQTQLDVSRDRLYKVAAQFGISKDEARRYVDQILAIPPAAVTNVSINAETALWKIQQVKDALALIKDKTVNVTTISQLKNQVGHGLGDVPGAATGGYITGPGTSTSDSILARLSNGEFVLRAAAVQHYGVDTLRAMNAKRFAGGGLAGTSTGGGLTGPVRLIGTLESPWGPVQVQGQIVEALADQARAISQEMW